MSKFIPPGMGWIPDLPDSRDYGYRHSAVLPLLQRLRPMRSDQLPHTVDLRSDHDVQYLWSAENQGPLNSSPAFAVLGLVEYFERRARGRTFDGSKLFLYKVARNRLRRTGDTGADLRTTIKAIVSFGVPPEEHWPYDVSRFDQEPSQFLYGLSKPFREVRFLRLDQPGSDGAETLVTVKSFLAAGFPVVFGFSVPTALTSDSRLPYRPGLDSVRGGQAVIAVGYQDKTYLPSCQAILVRSSWGEAWGDAGYGWLPYAYVRNHLARDFWTLVAANWIDSAEFSRPAIVDQPHAETGHLYGAAPDIL